MVHLRRTSLPLALVAALVSAACGDTPTSVRPAQVIDLTLPWQSAEPASVGVDAAALDAAAARAQAIPRFRSLLVIRDGRLVLERYFGGVGPDSLADVRSVTKSVVSTLTGIALERGYLASLDRTLDDLLPGSVGTLRPDERSITVRDLLTMTGGWEWNEDLPASYNAWVLSADPIQYLLDRSLAHPPGSFFQYNSAAVNLLGVILEEATGMRLPDFADQVLLGPLGITQRRWEPMVGGRVNGGAGFKLRPRDLARIGQLFLQDGVSGTDQVVPRDWVGAATSPHFQWTSDVGPTHVSYGYLWWTDADNDAFFAWGYRGQYIYVVPSRQLVVVATTAWWAIDGVSAPADLQQQALDVIVNGVLPAAPPE